MTPEERAEELLAGIYSVTLRVSWQSIPSGSMATAVTVDGYLPLLRDAVAAAIRAAVAEALEEAARLVYPKVRPPTIHQQTFDAGVHFAAAIRALITAADTRPPPAPAAPPAPGGAPSP